MGGGVSNLTFEFRIRGFVEGIGGTFKVIHVQYYFEVIRCTFLKIAQNSKIASYGAKMIEFWD